TVRGADAASCSVAMHLRDRVIVEDVTTSEIFAGQHSRRVLLDEGIRAVQSTPLVSGAHALIGMISTHSARPGRPTERAFRWLDLLARQAADYIERNRTERELIRLNAELREADLRKNEFLAMLGHELRNPLAAITTALGVLEAAERGSAVSRRSHTIVHSQ